MKVDKVLYDKIKADKDSAVPSKDETTCKKYGIGKSSLRQIRNTRDFDEYRERNKKPAKDDFERELQESLDKLRNNYPNVEFKAREISFDQIARQLEAERSRFLFTVILSFLAGVATKIAIDALLRR